MHVSPPFSIDFNRTIWDNSVRKMEMCMTRLSGDWPLERRLGKGDWACGYSVSGNCLCAGSGLLAANTRLALPPAAVGRTAVERRAARRDASPHRTAVERRSYHRTLRNAVVVGGWLKRRQDGGCPSQGVAAAVHTASVSAVAVTRGDARHPVTGAQWAGCIRGCKPTWYMIKYCRFQESKK